MYKIAFIGPKVESTGLKCLGIDCFSANTSSATIKILEDIVKEKQHSIILVAEFLAKECINEIESLKGENYLILPIPDSRGYTGLWEEIISNLKKAAIGREIKTRRE